MTAEHSSGRRRDGLVALVVLSLLTVVTDAHAAGGGGTALPRWLFSPGPMDILWWQWLVLPGIFAVAGLVGSLVSGGVRRLVAPTALRTSVRWDDAVLARIHGPLAVLVMLGVAKVLIPFAGFSPAMRELSTSIIRGAFLANLFWALGRGIDVATLVSTYPGERGERVALAALIRVAGRIGKFVVLAMAVIAFLSELGLPVTSLVAGLGIGGLAFALAAQKTVENLFGALSLGVDQPFKEGDMVRVDAFFGIVERVGLRSTRIRTLDRTIVTIPNGKLAEMSIESFAARDRFRLACTIGLVYETRAEQLRTIVAGFEQTLRAHPAIWPDGIVVRFVGFSEAGLNVEVMCWFATKDFAEFQVVRENVLLAFMRIVEDAGSSFAFPARPLRAATVQTT